MLATPTIPPDPRDQVIYLVMPDRYADGDPTNNAHVNRQDPHAYHGGDLRGLTKQLDQIKDLGVTTIWITPVNDNQNGPLAGKYWGYHGYWMQDFEKLDEHMGSEADMHAFVDGAHARGLKVILDVVVNHAGYDAPIVKQKPEWFHHNGSIVDWNDAYQCENFDLVGLPDFASENKDVLAFMIKGWGSWITRFGLDGFREDTVRHAPMAFWHDFNAKMHATSRTPFFTVGEVSYHDPRKIAPYLRDAGLDSAFDFPMFETLNRVCAKGESMTKLAARFAEDKAYTDARMLSPFLDNHDEVRFATTAKGDERKIRLGLAALLTMRGIPSLTWGTEVGLQGGADPENRHDMPFGQNPALRAYTKQLLGLRREHAAFRRGWQATLYADDQVIAYRRQAPGSHAVVVLNNADHAVTRHIPNPGARWVDALDGTRYGRSLDVTLAPYQARVLLPR
ncbi:MAG: alpha-amlyase [Cyanobacteria bacterium RYN_339]|nr:alpha-amlyase [Cyanobacteria bacterium RYN_339]